MSRIVVVGASAGGVRALQILAAQLPADFPAPVLVVQHIGSYPSILPELIAKSGALPAAHAEDGESVRAAHIHVAPPDKHMLIDGSVIRLAYTPKENHTRPAIDPLFRSAAVSWGPAVIGVLLTGLLDDGTAGLQSIKRCGGLAVVQDPDDAETPSMPLSALRYVNIDHRVRLQKMGSLLAALAREEVRVTAVDVDRGDRHENEILLGKGDFMEHLQAIGKPSTFVCPECAGTLWEVTGSEPPRYRCHTGHGYTLRSLQHVQSEQTDAALWSALRALHEKELLLRSMAKAHLAGREMAEGERLLAEADDITAHAATLRRLIESVPPPPE